MSVLEYADELLAARGMLIRDLAAMLLMRDVPVASPAAGAEFSASPPAGTYWEVVSVVARLVTDANVANRTPSLLLDDGTATGIGARAPINAAQTNGTTVLYEWGEGLPSIGTVGGMAQGGLPIDAVLSQGWRLRSSTVNLQVGDQWSQVVLLVREWSVLNLVWVSRYLAQTLAEQSAV